MAKQYLSPTGSEIIGTLERLIGRAEISGIQDDGTPKYAGETEVFWDDQTSVLRDGKRVFLDEDGAEWTFDQLKPVAEPEPEETDDDLLSYTVLIMLPAPMRKGTADEWVRREYVRAADPDHAFEKAQIQALQATHSSDDLDPPKLSQFEVLAIYSGHIFDLHQP